MKVNRSDDILIALDQLRQNEIDEGVEQVKARNFFRGSEVGHCSNQINFRRRGTPLEAVATSKSRFLEDGHLHQAVLSAEMKKAGINVTGEEEEKKVKITHDGTTFRLICHKDGSVEVDGEEYLLEVKSVKEERFKDLMTSNDVSSYYAQIQMYMYVYRYKKCKLIVVDRNNSLRLEYEIKRDNEFIAETIEKLAKIEDDLQDDKQSSRDYPRTSRECGWCPYFEKCWGVKRGGYARGEKAEKAVEVDGKKETKTWFLIVDLYRKYRRLSSEAKGYKEEADAMAIALLTRFKATKIHGEGGSVSKGIYEKQTPDKATIKQLIINGTIPVETVSSVSVRYNISGDEGEEE